MSTSPPIPPQVPPTRLIAVPVELAPMVDRMVDNFHRGAPVAQPLHYASPGPPRRPLIDLPLAIALGMFASVVTFLLVVVVPRFEDIFKDFGTKLPAPTIHLLTVSRFIGGGNGWIILWVVALAIPIAVARFRPWPPKRPMRGWVISILLAIFLIGAALIVTYILLQLPMISLIQSVSGGGQKKGSF